jgi:hypothetical protein
MNLHTTAIAACIASHAPIGTRYRLLDVPGTELTDVCPFCQKPSHAKMCDAQRAAMYKPLADDELEFQLEEQDYILERQINALRNELATAHAAIRERDFWLHEASKTIDKYAAKYGPISTLE